MRFRLRTLLIVLALGPPVLAGAWCVQAYWRQATYEYTLWHDPTRYAELEEFLITHKKSRISPDGRSFYVPEDLEEFRIRQGTARSGAVPKDNYQVQPNQ